MQADFASEPILLEDLEKAKTELHAYYIENYASRISPQSTDGVDGTAPQANSSNGSPAKTNFTARYQRCQPRVIDELEEYLSLTPQDFDRCRPLEWWRAQSSNWPNLYRLVCDIFCIPGGFFVSLFLTL